MTPKKQLVAQFYNASFDRSGRAEVADEREALRKSFEMRAFYFQTHEIATVELDGQTLKGQPENHSGRNYVGIDKLYTAAEIITQYQAELNALPKVKNQFDQIKKEALDGVIRSYREYGPHHRFIPDPWAHGDFIPLKETDRVFSSQGKQLWSGAEAGPKFEL
jgi:hypothetical protein